MNHALAPSHRLALCGGALGLLLALGACGGSVQGTKDDGGGPGGDGDGGSTTSPAYKVLGSLDAPCDGNASLTGRAVVSSLGKGTYNAVFTPIGGGADTPLTLTVSYSSGEVRCYAAFTCSCGAPDRPAHVEVVVDAHIKTGDGMFDESFTPTLDSSGSINGAVDVSALKGSYKPAISGQWDKHQVQFAGGLSSNGTTNGSASEQASSTSGNVGTGVAKGIGSWK